MSTPAKYSIKDLEILSNIKSHTIRIWEKRYNVLNPERTDTNIRYYTNEDLKKLLNVSFLNKHGIKISKIMEMSEEEVHQSVQSFNLTNSDNDTLIENLIIAMIDLNELFFHKTLTASANTLGFEKTITEIVFPFFHRIGVMWQTGVINPAQEHFVSNIIRQKIIAATDLLDYTSEDQLPKVLLFLPENELHELSLLLYNYSLRKRAYTTIYLGQAVPLESLQRIIEITSPDFLICSITNTMNNLDVGEILEIICQKFPGKIFVSGHAIREYKGPFPENCHQFEKIEELIQNLSQ